MATRIWQSTDGNWNNTASWGGTVPVNTDTIVFPRTNAVAPASNLNQDGIELALMIVEDGFTPDIGSSGNFLRISCNKVVHLGDGTLYFSDTSTVARSESVDNFIVNSNNLLNACQLQHESGSNVAIKRLCVAKGKVTVTGSLGSAGITVLEVHHRNNPGNDAHVVIAAPAGSARTIGTLLQYGGIVDNSQIITTAKVGGGRFTQTGNQAMTTLEVTGGYAIYNGTGTLTDALVGNGTLDCLQTSNARTITNAKRFGSGRILYNQLTTITNDFDTDGSGPSSRGGAIA